MKAFNKKRKPKHCIEGKMYSKSTSKIIPLDRKLKRSPKMHAIKYRYYKKLRKFKFVPAVKVYEGFKVKYETVYFHKD